VLCVPPATARQWPTQWFQGRRIRRWAYGITAKRSLLGSFCVTGQSCRARWNGPRTRPSRFRTLAPRQQFYETSWLCQVPRFIQGTHTRLMPNVMLGHCLRVALLFADCQPSSSRTPYRTLPLNAERQESGRTHTSHSRAFGGQVDAGLWCRPALEAKGWLT
jgi:hypothetical protein